MGAFMRVNDALWRCGGGGGAANLSELKGPLIIAMLCIAFWLGKTAAEGRLCLLPARGEKEKRRFVPPSPRWGEGWTGTTARFPYSLRLW